MFSFDHHNLLSLGTPRERWLVRLLRRGGLVTLASTAGVALVAAALEAHDFWIIPDPFAVASRGTIAVRGQSGVRFPESESAVPANRIVDARLIGAHGESRIEEITTEGKSLRLRQKPPAAGEYLVAVALEPRSTRTTRAGFNRYLTLEGAADEAARLQREGALTGGDSITYRVSKFAATIVMVGRGGDRAFEKSAGYSLEFIPTTDPARAQVGDTIALRVMANGRAVANLRVHAGAAADSLLRVRGSGTDPDLHLLTDGSGLVRVPLTKPGLWNVRTAHVVSPEDRQSAGVPTKTDSTRSVDWEVDWATFVFEVQAGGEQGDGLRRDDGGEVALAQTSFAEQTRSDSADVANAVLSFHAALAAGDTARVLSLLAPDAIVLESGDFETREEYRSHHLDADIAFARAVKSSRTLRRVVAQGDLAWVASTTTNSGEVRSRAINSVGAELMVLTRVPSGWQIRAIHWSSHARRAQSP